MAQATTIGTAGAVARLPRLRLRGSDSLWAVAFVLPYVAVFLAFVLFPVGYGLLLGSHPASYRALFADPVYPRTVVNTLLYLAVGVNLKLFLALLLSGFFLGRSLWRRGLLLVFILPWAVPAIPTFIAFHWMLNSQWGLINNVLWDVFQMDGPPWLDQAGLAMASDIAAYVWKWLPFWTLIFLAGRMAIPSELYEAAEIDGASARQRFAYVTFPVMANLYTVCTLLSTIWTLGDYNTVHFVSGGGPALQTHVLATLGIRDAFELSDPHMGMAAVISALPLLIPLVILLMRRLRRGEVQLWSVAGSRGRRRLARLWGALIGVLLLVWTLTPLYDMLLVAVQDKDAVASNAVWPVHPNLDSFVATFTESYWYLARFWTQMRNSLFIGVAVALLTLAIGSLASFAITRMRIRLGWLLSNAALLTYVIPASFLAIPFYRIMNDYGLVDNAWAVIAVEVTFATPYAIFIFAQYSASIPRELDEAARIDGASPPQVFWRVYLPLMAPALVAIGTYALLLAWNEYLYAFLLLSSDATITVPVALGKFLNSDEAPWNYLMAASIVYSVPPLVIYYGFRRYMAAGLTMGGVKG